MFTSSFEKIALPVNIFKGRIRAGVSPQIMKKPVEAVANAVAKPIDAAAAAKAANEAKARANRIAEATGNVTDAFTWRRALRQKG